MGWVMGREREGKGANSSVMLLFLAFRNGFAEGKGQKEVRYNVKK